MLILARNIYRNDPYPYSFFSSVLLLSIFYVPARLGFLSSWLCLILVFSRFGSLFCLFVFLSLGYPLFLFFFAPPLVLFFSLVLFFHLGLLSRLFYHQLLSLSFLLCGFMSCFFVFFSFFPRFSFSLFFSFSVYCMYQVRGIFLFFFRSPFMFVLHVRISLIFFLFQVGYPVLTLAGDGSTSQTRFLAMAGEEDAAAAAGGGGGGEAKTIWTIPAKVVWEGGGELVVMLEGQGGGVGDRKLQEKLQELQAAGKWFKAREIFSSKTSKLTIVHTRIRTYMRK